MTTILGLEFDLTCKCDALLLLEGVFKNRNRKKKSTGTSLLSPPTKLVKPLLHCQHTIVCVIKGFHTISGGKQAGQKHYTPNTPCFCLRYEQETWRLTASACRGNSQSYAWMCPSHLWGCALETEVLKVCFCVSARGAGGWSSFEKLWVFSQEIIHHTKRGDGLTLCSIYMQGGIINHQRWERAEGLETLALEFSKARAVFCFF